MNQKIDRMISDNVYKVLISLKKYETYIQIANDLDVNESFIKQVFTYKKKFNIYHLYKLAEINNLKISELLPEIEYE